MNNTIMGANAETADKDPSASYYDEDTFDDLIARAMDSTVKLAQSSKKSGLIYETIAVKLLN